MANSDIEVNNLIINELTKTEFESAEKSDTELYFVTDTTLSLIKNYLLKKRQKSKQK